MDNTAHQEATRYMHDRLGREAILRLHKENHFYDALALISIWATFFVLMYLLASLPFGWIWLGCFILQGFVLQMLGFCSHDLFTHRRVGGQLVSRIGGMLCLTPLLVSATAVTKTHLEHHRYFGTKKDSEAYKSDLDRRWVKLFFLCLPGILLVTSRKLSRQPTDEFAYMGSARYQDKETVNKVKFEQKVVIIFIVCVIGLAIIWPGYILLGYVLPLFLAMPLASTLRTVLEHADIQPENPFNTSTNFKTGFVSRLLFFWDSGDCHIVHHFFPSIPFYRIGSALELMSPIFKEKGAIEQKSLVKIIYKWFVENRVHGTNWQQPGQQEVVIDR
ncbi:MAG: fatty acid desaturase [Burkholderiales bacterium]|nr:fatty acid desaturase [Burkholderiales bacterium]MDR4517442.1 fatty acid desaturase [Nitrosomonas sp.]